MPYIDSYYSRTLADPRERAALAGIETADVCIIGAGLAGLTTALELVRAGRSVVLLEAEAVGWGASGRNGGFVSPGYSRGLSSLEAAIGEEPARKLYGLSIEGMDIVAENIRALGITDAQRVDGILRVIRYNDPGSLQRMRNKAWDRHNYRLDFWDTDKVRETLVSKKYRQALLDPQAFHIHPLNYARALAAAIEAAGGRIFEHSRAVSAELDQPEKIIRTAAGEVRAEHVVFTGGGYTDRLVPRLRDSQLPIATYVLITEPAPERLATAIRTRAAALDDRRASDYYRLVDDGRRLLWGGRITTRTSEPRRLAEMLRRSITDTYPQLDGIKVEAAWTGLMSYARHLMPQIGQLQPNVWHCLGFGGHGLNTTAIGGRVVAEAITGQSDRVRLFEPFGLVWNGGPAGRAAVQLTYWRYQALDWLREARAG
ncbi:NAD(P)/FAD-dependent oxidoreductase [Bosea caraganae]|uniref:NAD(P)/FAD-dependent oxidoreductase n=1 Tax=Bosea caraganae TaxID=2763117 RepID=UPI0015F0B582|nr:FAD-binding oxidoreductase [Bosea caraganae]